MVSIKGLTFSYGSREILRNISFDVNEGECVALLGNNGVGKSTLISCVNKIKTPKRGDVITFWSDECGEVLVKRVIGLPGETVSFGNGCVSINGELLEENYLPVKGITQCDESFAVPEGCVFFMGDNRTGSFDARYWQNHYIPVEELQAKALLTISIGRNHSWTGIRLITK